MSFTERVALALHERAERCNVVGADKKGRTLVELVGERGPNEVWLDTLQAVCAVTRGRWL